VEAFAIGLVAAAPGRVEGALPLVRERRHLTLAQQADRVGRAPKGLVRQVLAPLQDPVCRPLQQPRDAQQPERAVLEAFGQVALDGRDALAEILECLAAYQEPARKTTGMAMSKKSPLSSI